MTTQNRVGSSLAQVKQRRRGLAVSNNHIDHNKQGLVTWSLSTVWLTPRTMWGGGLGSILGSILRRSTMNSMPPPCIGSFLYTPDAVSDIFPESTFLWAPSLGGCNSDPPSPIFQILEWAVLACHKIHKLILFIWGYFNPIQFVAQFMGLQKLRTKLHFPGSCPSPVVVRSRFRCL